MRYNGTEEEVTLFRRGLSRSCEPSFQGGRGRMARPGPRWTGTGIEQWSVVDGSMGWQRTAQRIGNTGVPCGGQMEGLEGLGGVTQPGGAWLPVFARPAKKLASRAVGTCREGRCPFSRPRSSASCTRLGYHKKKENRLAVVRCDIILHPGLAAVLLPARRHAAWWCVFALGNPVLSTRNPSIDWSLPSPPLPLAAMSQRFACAVSPHHHFGVEDGWGGLGGNDSHAFFFRPCPRLHHCFGRFGQWRVNMGGQTLQIGRRLVDATADPRAGRVRVRLSRGLGGTATRSRNAHWGRGRLVARHAAATRTRFLSIQRLSPSICLLLAMFPQVACPLCG